MHYIKLPHMDSPVSVFAVCQAHAQLEADYNKGGFLSERPSNLRRNASTACQLSRMGYSSPFQWVDIIPTGAIVDDSEDEDIRGIYLINVLKLGLPMDAEMRAFIAARYVPEFLATFKTWSN